MSSRTELILIKLGIEIAARRGSRVWTKCPFHDSKGATSFFIRTSGPRAGQSHCFSCKKGGGIVDLVMHVRGFSRDDAKKYVATIGAAFEPPKVRARVVMMPPKLGRTRFRMPSEIINEPLADWIGPARDYATRRCRLTAEEVEQFGIGYAVDGIRLACRIVLPWLGAGRIAAGYSARTYIDEEPKYQTPAAYENADRATMFGEHLWPVSERTEIVVTEGALNALAVRRAWEDVAIAAIGGSEIDPLQIAKLATFKRVVIVTDPDPAGNKAATYLGKMLSRYADITRVELPVEKDALDIEREHGTDHLAYLIEQALAP